MRKGLFGLLMALAAAGFSAWAWARLPDRVISHWNAQGQPDGWSSRLFLAALMPALMAGLALLFLALPRIDPLRRNYELHGGTYWTIVNVVFLVLAGIHVVTLGANMGWNVRIEQWVPIAVGILFIVIGNLMSRIRPNWFMGIRTPWTLSSEVVWRKTHRLGGYLFVAAGICIAAVAVGDPRWGVAAAIAGAGVAAVVPIVYSYLLWRRQTSPGA